jgi:hypothetical protein
MMDKRLRDQDSGQADNKISSLPSPPAIITSLLSHRLRRRVRDEVERLVHLWISRLVEADITR